MNHLSEFLAQAFASGSGGLSFTQSLFAIVMAYFGGILASLTPCVYPMIPITVSVVTGMGPSRKSFKGVYVRGMSYVAGMALVYSLLGVLAGVSGKVFGSFTNTSGWYLALGIIMTVAALLMLEVVYFDPLAWWEAMKRKWSPSKATNPSAHFSKEMTLAGAFTLGASSGLIAAPCTTPVLTSILAFIAKTQSVGLGFLLMLSFSLGLGTLLLFVAAFAGAVQVLPRSGSWMKAVKIGSGLILLAFGEYLIYLAGNRGGL